MAKPTYEELEGFVRSIPAALEHYWFSTDGEEEYNNEGVIDISDQAVQLVKRFDAGNEVP